MLMSKFYIMMAASLMAITASAAVSDTHSLRLKNHDASQPAPCSTSGAVKCFPIADLVNRYTSAPAKNAKAAPAKKLSSADIIFDRPEGTSEFYNRSSQGFFVFFGNVFVSADAGACVEMVTTPDGRHYINNLISGLRLDAWMECEVDGDKITVAGGQPVFYYAEDDYEELYTIHAFDLYQDDESAWYMPAQEDVYSFSVSADGVISSVVKDNSQILGLGYVDGDSPAEWVGYGDFNFSMTPFSDTAVLPDDDVARSAERWSLIAEGDAYFTNVAVDKDEVWLQGIYKNMPDAWVKLDRDGDKCTMPMSTYLGITSGHYVYCQPAKTESVYDDYYEQYVDQFVPSDSPVLFDFNESAKSLKAGEASVVFAYTLQDNPNWTPASSIKNPVIMHQERTPGTPPGAPKDLIDDDTYSDMMFIEFTLEPFDTDGNLLDTSRLYYNLLVDDNLFTFYPDQYTYLTEEITDIPYDFVDGWDIYVEGTKRTVYYTTTGVDTWGIRAIYVEDDGSKVYSDITRIASAASAVKGIQGHAAAQVEYFDLNGIRVNNPGKGIFIRKAVDKDGMTSFSKIAR